MLAIFAIAVLSAMSFGRGGRGFFSPDTLEFRHQGEWLVPIVNVPILRTPRSAPERWDLVNFLITKEYWRPVQMEQPRWQVTFRWNQQWRDGQSQTYRELAWRGNEWIEWSEANPEIAKRVWPAVLSALRHSESSELNDAWTLLRFARGCDNVRQLERILRDVPETESLIRATTQPSP